MTDYHIEESLEAYALDTLDSEERVEVEQHLQKCPHCREAATELANLAGLLPQALSTASTLRPPEALKNRLLASLTIELAAETVLIAERQADETGQDMVESLPKHSLTPTDGRLAQASKNSVVWSWLTGGRLRPVIVMVLLLLLILSVFLGMQLSIVLAQERALRVELANLFGQQELVLEVIDSDQTVRRVLRAPEPRRSQPLPPYGKLFTRPDLPHVVAMVARLPQPPAGQAYYLWVTRQGQVELAGLMEVNDQGFSLLAFDDEQDGPVYDSAQITLQPVGAATPSGDPILQWDPSLQ